MTQRRKIRGADLKPDPVQYNGINAEKCVRYLRGIGVDIPDEMADEWLDTQGVHRFLESEEASRYLFYEMSCRCGELKGVTVRRRGRKTKTTRVTQEDEDYFCKGCESFITSYQRLIYEVKRNGAEKDWRPVEERVSDPFDWREFVT